MAKFVLLLTTKAHGSTDRAYKSPPAADHMTLTQAAAPRLLRAVVDSTQPYGPLLEGNALHTLQVREDTL